MVEGRYPRGPDPERTAPAPPNTTRHGHAHPEMMTLAATRLAQPLEDRS